jgi:hypothetical protein
MGLRFSQCCCWRRHAAAQTNRGLERHGSNNRKIGTHWRQRRIGNQTFINGSNGYRATEQQFGGQTFGSDNLGNRWNTNTFGHQTYMNLQPRTRNW